MVCAQIGISIFSAIILALVFWPNMLSAGLTQGLIIASALIIAIIAWTGTVCKCDLKPSPKRK